MLIGSGVLNRVNMVRVYLLKEKSLLMMFAYNLVKDFTS